MTATTPICIARLAGSTNAESPTFAEERREVFETVLAALAGNPLDADRLAAASYLMRHLSRTAGTPPLPA